MSGGDRGRGRAHGTPDEGTRDHDREQGREREQGTAHHSSLASLEIHYKLFGTDGVSLQSQELSRALVARGWRVLPCASDVPDGVDGLRLAPLSYQTADVVQLRERIFAPALAGGDPGGGAALVSEIEERAAPLRRSLEAFIDARGIGIVHVRNLLSLPYNLPASVAVHALASERRDLGFLMQHHDLYWEGPNARTFVSPYPEIAALLDRVMCPDLPNSLHVLINPIAAEALWRRRGIRGTVVPDGFDFERPVPHIDEHRFRSMLTVLTGDRRSVADDDLIVAMPARVAVNKAIELAIQFVHAMEAERPSLEAAGEAGSARRRFSAASRVILLLPQGEDLDDNRDYFERLLAYAEHLGVTVAYGGDVVVPDSRYAGDAGHVPFYGTYRTMDFVCYPPEHEGFGNQAIETVWARRPLAVLEYPVFQAFVAAHLPHFVSLGDVAHLERIAEFGGLYRLRREVAARAVGEAVALLLDRDRLSRWEEENQVALRSFCGIDVVSETYLEMYRRLLDAPDTPTSSAGRSSG